MMMSHSSPTNSPLKGPLGRIWWPAQNWIPEACPWSTCSFVWTAFCWSGGRWFHVRMNYLLWTSIVNTGSRMPKAGRIYFVIHFKLYISSFTIKSSEDDIYVNERKSEIIILSRFVVVQLFHIYIDHDHFCTCIKNSNHIRPLLILGILAYDRRKLYCFHGNKNFLLLCRTCTILVEI